MDPLLLTLIIRQVLLVDLCELLQIEQRQEVLLNDGKLLHLWARDGNRLISSSDSGETLLACTNLGLRLLSSLLVLSLFAEVALEPYTGLRRLHLLVLFLELCVLVVR